MDEYRRLVNKLADSKENVEIPNSDAAHAALLIATFFERAKKEICLFTGELFKDVYDNEEIRINASAFLKRPRTLLRIAYQKSHSWDELRKQSSLLEYLFSLPADIIKGKIQVYNASKIPEDWSRHFALMDGEAYRYELDHVQRTAVANFGDNENAKKLATIFQVISEKGEQVFA
ncbi:MAG TPA: hypothetical protein VLX29_02270 [Nitrospirota bacterium]|nr:hypothetical protein [Nitrospirota bacterium]